MVFQTYSCFIRDRRYSVPTLVLIDAPDDESARSQALHHLANSRDHLGIELHSAVGLILKRERRTFHAERRTAEG